MHTSTSIAETAPGQKLRPAAGDGSLRVALIGCGAIAEQMHLPVLAGHKVLKLAALVDRSKERARRFASGYGVPHVLEDAGELTRDTVDAAIIATPPFHHAPCAIELVRKGIHVLVEKPMATNLADAEQMVAEAERAGVVLSVGFFRRLFPSIRLMKSLLDSGWAGRPLSFRVEGGGMYSWSAATLGNMRRETAGGGVLIDFGSHMIDLLFALFHEPADVISYSDNAIGGIEADCTIELRVRHRGEPVEGRVELARTRELGSLVRVECERASLEFQVSERFRVKVVPRGVELTDPLSNVSRDFAFDAAWEGESQDESWYATFGRQFDDWIGAIQSGGEPVLSSRSSLATVRLIESCYHNPKLMPEPWVWNRISPPEASQSAAVGDASGDGRAVIGVHTGGRRGRILVTGATGFIGCRVVELLRLREKCDIRAVVHNPGNASRLARLDVEMVRADLSSGEDVKNLVKDCAGIVHCAIGTTYGDPGKIAAVTVDGTRRLAAAALTCGVQRFVHVSSMSVYGQAAEQSTTIDESWAISPQPHDHYGVSKAAAENAVFAAARRGLTAVIIRPARVFGPFSRTFIVGPLRAIAAGQFAWLGPPDVAADLVYVDNVAESLLCALFADGNRVKGQAFNIGSGDNHTWREFYTYFADALGFDLSSTPVCQRPSQRGTSALGSVLSFPGRFVHGVGEVVTSTEFKSLGRRVLMTAPVGTMPRKALERMPTLERSVRQIIKADDTLPLYRPQNHVPGETVHMGSGGAVLSNEKLCKQLGFVPPVCRNDALQLTFDWVRHARIV